MKKIYLFCTNPAIYLIELPVIILLALAIMYNGNSDKPTKLYPLIIFLIFIFIFIFVYFFRAISISFEEIRYHGLFSGRDHATINKDKELIITTVSRTRLKVELFGNDGTAPELDFIKKGEEFVPMDIYLFRGKSLGSGRTVRKILTYFEVPADDVELFLNSDLHFAEYEFVNVKSIKKEEQTEIRIKIKETV